MSRSHPGVVLDALDNLTPDAISGAASAGDVATLSDRLAVPEGLGAEWAVAELSRLATTWPADHDDAVTSLEARFVLTLAALANENGYVEIPRRDIARAVHMNGPTIGDCLSWASWRGVLKVHRVSAPGETRVDRIRLHHWPAARRGAGPTHPQTAAADPAPHETPGAGPGVALRPRPNIAPTEGNQ